MTIEEVFEKDDNKELVQCAVKVGVKKVVKRNKKQYNKLAEHIGLFSLVMVLQLIVNYYCQEVM